MSRWQNYVLERGDGLTRFWREHLGKRERHVLFVLGLGFDPRMCLGDLESGLVPVGRAFLLARQVLLPALEHSLRTPQKPKAYPSSGLNPATSILADSIYSILIS